MPESSASNTVSTPAADDGFWCQNCSRVWCRRRGDVCDACKQLLAGVTTSDRSYTIRPATIEEAQEARFVVGLPRDASYPVWQVEGPYMNHFFIGVTESCGRSMVHALNLAYKVGQRAERDDAKMKGRYRTQ